MQRESARRLRQHYGLITSEARAIAMEEWEAAGNPSVRLATIGPTALAEASQWRERKVDWDWTEPENRWSHRPRHFGFTAWADPKLCALGLGRVSDGSVIARLDRLERAPTTLLSTGRVRVPPKTVEQQRYCLSVFDTVTTPSQGWNTVYLERGWERST